MDSNEIPPVPPPLPPSSPPPPLRPPPPLTPPRPVPQPRRSRGWMVLAIVLLVLLMMSVLANFGQLANGLGTVPTAHVRRAGPRIEEAILEDNRATSKIAVIDVDGIVTGRAIDQNGFTMVDLLKAQLDRAGEDRHVKAVVLRIDSPGGEVLASDEMYRALLDFQEKWDKPVITSMGDLAASGGYYIAAGSQWIVANELTITGSIGVILHSWNYWGLMNKVGLKPEIYKSGTFKDMLSGDRNPSEIPAEEREMVNALIMQTFSRFKEVVAEGRERAHDVNQELDPENPGQELVDTWAEYADGRVLSGKQAFELGFVDELGNFRDAVNRAKKLSATKGNVNLVRYQQRYDLSDLFRIFGKTETTVVKVDVGGLEPPRLEAGRLYFLSPTFIH